MKRNVINYIHKGKRSSIALTDTELQTMDYLIKAGDFQSRGKYICYIIEKKSRWEGVTKAIRDKMLEELYNRIPKGKR